MRSKLEDQNTGVSVDDRSTLNLRYADTTALVAKDEEELMEMINRLKALKTQLELCIKASNTEVMVVD